MKVPRSKRTEPVARAVLAAVALVVAASAAGDPLSDGLQPEPGLGPTEVVRIQLEALRRNDTGDRGIAVAFRFASPGNKRSTGPLPRFAAMIKQGPYALMLGFTDADYAPVRIDGRLASQRVTLAAPGQAPVTYVFYLSRQDAEGPLKECWMTDGVSVVPYAGGQA
jgi:hypothetical protein